MKTVVFVIISVGMSDYLEPMIQTIRGSYPLILVDNSDDALLSPLSKKYEIYYIHEMTKGVSAARNAGSELAKLYDYIFFLDDDLELIDGWKETLEKILVDEKEYDCVGGRVIAKYDKNIRVPEKYSYLVGEKNLGNQEKKVVQDYIGGCNLLIRKKLFFEVGKFNTNFGHRNGKIGLNEDVLFQDTIRKKRFEVLYMPEFRFIHHWNGTEQMLFTRIRLQGNYDRQLDLRINKIRFFLRIIKYLVFLCGYQLFLKNRHVIVYMYDFMRYYEYIFNYKNSVAE
ncbi:MAG: glycosyltransferase [Candidatus Brocadiae bacterium]|nr:glycosyltransferase [Candidatus Brocadiia bacterium]